MAEAPDNMPEIPDIRMVVPCTDIDHHLDQLVGNLGFRIFSVFPADNPRVVIVEKGGAFIRLEKQAEASDPGVFPNGYQAETLLEAVSDIAMDQLSGFYTSGNATEAVLALSAPDEGSWIPGRAGMSYRDLIPGRLNGKLLASHIRISEAGPVPDYVHFHSLDLQVIYCLKGWCELVYESQGKPFRLDEGDCVLQPPGIRHRVLECSEGFEVLEISSPAEHPTFAEHSFELPDSESDPEKDFGGQRFHRHVSDEPHGTRSDLGLEGPSGGVVRGELVTFDQDSGFSLGTSSGSPVFFYVVEGNAVLAGISEKDIGLTEGMACLITQTPAPGLVSRSSFTKVLAFTFDFQAGNTL